MSVSTKSIYGLRALLFLAKVYSGKPMLLKRIAAESQLPEKYLEAIFASLKTANIVKAYRGKGGGYVLNRAADEISLYEIIFACDGEFDLLASNNESILDSTAKIWEDLNRYNIDYLKKITLLDLLGLEDSMYHI